MFVILPLLQKHKPGELEFAAKHMDRPPGHDILHEFGPELLQFGGPPTLYFGDSHILHLKAHVQKLHIEDKYKVAFNRSEFVGVGETTWAKIRDHIFGIDLAPRQQYLGAQWPTYRTSSHKATFTAICLGSKEIEQFQAKILKKGQAKEGHEDEEYSLEVEDEMRSELEKIKKDIDDVLLFLSNELEGTIFLYYKIIPRSWWGLYARKLARWVDYYILVNIRRAGSYHIREIWCRELFDGPYHLMEEVLPGMLTTDWIHFNENGNKAIIHATMRPLLHIWRAYRRNHGMTQPQLNIVRSGKDT